MSIRHGLQSFGALGLAKVWDEEDHPRDRRGRWSSGDAQPVDHDSLQNDDRKAIGKVNAWIDNHLDAIHEARKQSVQHIKALRDIQKTVSKHHDKALAALDEHYGILDQYEEGVFPDIPIADDSDEFDRALGFRQGLEESVAALMPEIQAGKLKDIGGSTASATIAGSASSAPPPGGTEADDLARELAALISGARK